ncbi:DNA recombination protein RmuC [Novilysobacter avium]|uniref:DNA recombination protein RmuC n=1 Tax=Novilysobacter avium TaxID=2781023 RepID=A0A7S6UKQ0_9GAMM|nr:DNA recombination protein RmuC [Lysobacter avium]QOW22092.1 DNA recombination protein RmuC [Lysobacter avium]
MDSQLLIILLLVATLVVAGLLMVLLRRQGSQGPGAELGGLREERDRLGEELRAERGAAREHASESGRLLGRLSALETAIAERDQVIDRLETARAGLQEALETERLAARSAGQSLQEREQALLAVREREGALAVELAELRDSYRHLQSEHAGVSANLQHARQAHTEMQTFLAEAQTKLSGAFTELAGKVFEEKGQLFEKNVQRASLQSRADIDALLKPFAERIGEFRSRVDTLYGEEARERASLLGAVTELKTLNQDMAQQAHALTRALKGSSKVRGDWGELMLESVLRGSGLEDGVHYDRQKGTVDEDGARLHPDIVVRLPDERCVVVDSKVNLIAWQEAMNADTPDEQNDALRRHAAGLRQHMRELSEKNYPKVLGDTALEVTIAFIPIEGALSAALGTDTALQTDAFDRRVVFASPNTLMALLRVVERLWTRDKIQREAIAISDTGGLVLDALMGFLADFDKVGKSLDDADKAFKNARRRLSESSQAVIPRARRLAELGAHGRRALTDELKPEADSGGVASTDAPAKRLLGAALGSGNG